MKFCHSLFTDINFEPESIQPCCNTYGLNIPSFPYSGGKIDAEALYRDSMHILKELQHNDTLCAGCKHLHTADMELPEKGFHLISYKRVSINHHRYFCNCKCVYCNLWKPRKQKPLYSVYDGIVSLYENNLLSTACQFSWGGGESTILKEFKETALWIAKHAFFQCVHTNAMQVSPAIMALLEHGMCSINISLDAGTKETHQRIKGVNSWQQVIDTCTAYSKYASSPKAIVMKYIVFEENNDIEEIKAFLRICQNLNISTIELSLNFAEVRANTVSQKTIDAAIYLYRNALKVGLVCTPFYMNEPYLTKIFGPVNISEVVPQSKRI